MTNWLIIGLAVLVVFSIVAIACWIGTGWASIKNRLRALETRVRRLEDKP